MRRFLLVLLVLVAATTFVVGQEFGPTWIDSQNVENSLFPTSYLAYVSSGAFTDEIDVILRSPLSMGFYEGYGIFTLYGNYSTVWGMAAPNNPFTTTAPDTDTYQLGATMPVGDGMRAGFVTRYQSARDDRIVGGLRSIEGSETEETYEPAGPDAGRVNITEVESYAFEFGDTTRNPIAGAGLTMGTLGVSLFGYSFGIDRMIGGAYEYSYTPHDDFDPAAQELTAESIIVGRHEEGTARSYPADREWGLTALGQLPLELFGSDSPLTAHVGLIGATNDIGLNNVKTVYSATNTDYTDPETPEETTTVTYGETLGVAWNPLNITPPAVVFGTSAAAVNPYHDLDGTGDRIFGLELGGGIDPVRPLTERITLNAKAHLGLGMGLGSDDEALAATIAVADPDQTWESTFTSTASDSSFVFDITSDLGGRVEFRDTAQVVTLSSGLFMQPGLTRSSVTPDTSTTVLARTSTGDALATLAAGSLDGQTAAAAAAAINAGTAGTSTLTTTTEYEGRVTESTFTFDMVIPTSVRVDLFEGAMSLVGGYNISHGHTFTTERDNTVASTRQSAVVTSDGVEIYNETGQPTDEVVARDEVTRTTATAPWAGQMAWMVRWQPTESLTIDLEGQSVMNALNFDIFGGAGFNPSNLLAALNISMSFRY